MQITRRSLLAGAAALALGTVATGGFGRLLAGPARAASAAASVAVGDFRVIPLLDGVAAFDQGLFPDVDAVRRDALLAAAGEAPGQIHLDVNAYLIEQGDKRILVDAGARSHFGPTLGLLPQALVEAGISPSEITHVLLTHMHIDHVGGLIDAEGKRVFDGAELVVGGTEWDFWASAENAAAMAAIPEAKMSFDVAGAVIGAYAERARMFGPGGEVLPGIFGVDLPGHSPGHSGFRLSSGTDQLIIWGDVIVAPQLQFDEPGWAARFDADPDRASATRRRLLDEVATDKVPVAGMHLPFPGTGHVTRRGAAFGYESA